MRFLRQNTAVILTVGPFYDATNGVTIENSLTITNERITLTADTDAGSAPTIILDNVTGAASGTDNDLNYITNCDAGLMQLELSAANTNRVGRAMLTITDAANHVPVFHEFMILPGAVYDSLILGTDLLAADAQEIHSDATAASNAEAFFDGTGYAGTNNVIPTVTSVTGLAAGAVDSIVDEVIEGSYTMRQMLRMMAAALLGKVSGGGTATITFRDTGDSANRIVATVDANGNRTAVTLTAT